MIASLLLLSLSSACCLAANDNDKPINFPTRRTTEAANDKPIFFPNRRPQDHAEPLICPPVMNQRHAQNLSQLVRSNKFVDFDWNLIQELIAVEKGNIVISPIILKVVLAMLYEGAKGKTAIEIAEALDLTNTTLFRMTSRNRFSTILKSLETSKGEYEIKIGTHVFIDKNAEPKKDYQCTLRNYYNSAIDTVDFSNTTAAVNTINNWASSETEGHIQHLISDAEAHSSTIMLLLNAVYFKGFWEAPFPEDQTRLGPFYMDGRGSVDCALMNTTGRFAYYNITDLNAQIIRLPYSGGKFAMYILLPDRRSGLDNLTQALGPDRPLTGYLQNMTMTAINLILPRFEIDFTASLRPTLEKLGIKRMFTQEADLSDIADTSAGGDLIVSNVLQKARISVREFGAISYAATVAELMDKLGDDSEEVIHFRANHPFLFFIEDESTKTTVLVGKLTDPEQNGKTLSSPTPEPSVEGSNSFQTDEDTAVVEDPEYAENNGLICKSVSTAGGFYERSVHVSPRNIHRANGDRLSLKFMVQATSYVLITLSPTDIATEDATDRYHIGLGHNQSLILREREGVRTIKAENYTGNTLSGTELQSFWVRITQDGTILVGNGGEDLPFLEWRDPEPLTINYFSFGSFDNVTTKWLYDCSSSYENDETENNGLICKSVSTAGGFYERSVPVSPRNIHRANGDRLSLKFMVQATSNVLITLSPTDIVEENATDNYHIGLGHGNNYSAIWLESGSVRTIMAEDYTGNTLSGTELKSFWVGTFCVKFLL